MLRSLFRAGGARGEAAPLSAAASQLLARYSIEVMPKSAAAVEDFRAVLPPGTRVYIAHIEGTPFEVMLATARRIRAEGFPVMPHFPARIIPSRQALDDWTRRYREEAGVDEALVLAGSPAEVAGPFTSAMELLETGVFEQHGYRRLHVAGHPEGNTDIDPVGSTAQMDAALQWKQAHAARSRAEMAIVTQFCFEAEPVARWIQRIRGLGITLPVHVGIAGPAKLQTVLRFAIACGVGQSLRVLRNRAADAANLLRPFPPDAFIEALTARTESGTVAGLHVFPFGGVKSAASWARTAMGSTAPPG